MKVKKIFRYFFVFIFAFFIAATSFLSGSTVKAFAASSGDFSSTKIENDLNSIGYDTFNDLLEIPDGESHRVIAVSEYCYSDSPDMSRYYGLYLYIYNVEGTAIKTSSPSNVVNMAVEYDTDGQPIYKNWELSFCDRSDGSVSKYGDFKYYKFKVKDSETLYRCAEQYAIFHEGQRRYDVAGVQLHYVESGERNDESYSQTLYFSGFAAGCDASNPEGESTLQFRSENLETIKLDVTTTNWRGAYKNNIATELHTAYFSVPKSLFEKYGNLQKISAEWYEYKTKYVYVTNDSTAHHDLTPYIGKDIGLGTEALPWVVLWESEQITEGHYQTTNTYTIFNKAYNRNNGDNYNYYWDGAYYWNTDKYVADAVSEMQYLFYRPEASSKDSWRVTSEEMQSYMKEETIKRESTNFVSGGEFNYDAALFEDSIDSQRLEYLTNQDEKRGHVRVDIPASYDQKVIIPGNRNWWDKLCGKYNYKTEALDSIVTLTDSDLSNETAFEKSFYLTNKNIKTEDNNTISLFEKAKSDLELDKVPVLFRFAVTDYYASNARFEGRGNKWMSNEDGYVAQETVFLGFDIISLEFNTSTGVRTVLGAVSNPIDVINGIEPQDDIEDFDWSSFFRKFLAVLLLVLLIVLLAPVLPVILPMLGTAISAIFKGLLWFLKLPFTFFNSIKVKKKANKILDKQSDVDVKAKVKK